MTNQPKTDIHASVTNRIVTLIEAGAGEFRMPWHRASTPLHMPINALTKKRYRGINVVSLWASAEERGYSSNAWGTYRQWAEKGGQVRKGERGSIVTVYKEFSVEPEENNAGDDGRRMFARASWVFNSAQVDGLETIEASTPNLGPIEHLAHADAFLVNTRAIIKTGGDRAFYRPSDDTITLPSEALFIGEQQTRREAYYATAMHELTHWTGVKKRLDREFGKRFGDEAYAFEELVAELGAAFLCSILGVTNSPRQDHAQYLSHWLTILKADKRAIFTAAAKASAATDYLENMQHVQQQAMAA